MEPLPHGEPIARDDMTMRAQLSALRRLANPYVSSMSGRDRLTLKRLMLEACYDQERIEVDIRDRSWAQVRAEQLIAWLGGVSPMSAIEDLVETGLRSLPSYLRSQDSARDMLKAVAVMIETAEGGIRTCQR